MCKVLFSALVLLDASFACINLISVQTFLFENTIIEFDRM